MEVKKIDKSAQIQWHGTHGDLTLSKGDKTYTLKIYHVPNERLKNKQIASNHWEEIANLVEEILSEKQLLEGGELKTKRATIGEKGVSDADHDQTTSQKYDRIVNLLLGKPVDKEEIDREEKGDQQVDSPQEKKELKKLKKENKALREKLIQLLSEKNTLHTKSEEYEKKIQISDEKINKLKEQIEISVQALEKEVAELENLLLAPSLSEQTTEKVGGLSLFDQLKDVKEINSDSRLEHLKNRINQLRGPLKGQVEMLSQENEEKTNKISDQLDIIDQLTVAMQKMQKTKEEDSLKFSQRLEEIKRNFSEKMDELNEKMKRLKNENRRLKEQLKDTHIHPNEKLSKELLEKKQMIEKLNTKIISLEREISMQKNELKKKEEELSLHIDNSQNSPTKQQFTTLQLQNEKLESELKDLRERESVIHQSYDEELTSKTEKFLMASKKLEGDIGKLKDEISQLKEEKRELEEENKELLDFAEGLIVKQETFNNAYEESVSILKDCRLKNEKLNLQAKKIIEEAKNFLDK